jgi:hypothetical protein
MLNSWLLLKCWLLLEYWLPLLLNVHMLIPDEPMVRSLIVTVRHAKRLLFASSVAVELWDHDLLVTTLIV